MFDMHIHTTFSHDAKSTMEEYISLLDSNPDIKGIGFTDHVDFFNLSSGFNKFDYKGFMGKINQYKEEGYPVYAGAEIGYVPEIEDEILEHVGKSEYDYVIVSIHRDGEYSFSTDMNIDPIKDHDYFLKKIKYYYNTTSALINLDGCDVIGHLGIFKRFLAPDFFKGLPFGDRLLEMEAYTANLFAQSDKIIEVNTSGLSTKYAQTFPDTFFLKDISKKGGRNICLGSDAHRIGNVGRGFKEAVGMLENIGFTYQILPWNREKVPLGTI